MSIRWAFIIASQCASARVRAHEFGDRNPERLRFFLGEVKLLFVGLSRRRSRCHCVIDWLVAGVEGSGSSSPPISMADMYSFACFRDLCEYKVGPVYE